MRNNNYLNLNILILSLITINIFPSAIAENLLGYRFTSIPIITVLVIFYISLKNISYINYEIKNILNILIFLTFTFLISLNQSIIENNFLIFLRYFFPIFLSFLVFQYLNKNNNYDISNIIIIILIIFIIVFIIQRYDIFNLHTSSCKIILKYQLITRGSCDEIIRAETFLSTEPSYHAFSVFGLFILYKLYNERNLQKISNKKKVYINFLFLFNLIIIPSTLAKIFSLFFIIYLSLSFIIFLDKKKNNVHFNIFLNFNSY